MNILSRNHDFIHFNSLIVDSSELLSLDAMTILLLNNDMNTTVTDHEEKFALRRWAISSRITLLSDKVIRSHDQIFAKLHEAKKNYQSRPSGPSDFQIRRSIGRFMKSLNRLARRFSWTVWTDSSKFGGGPLGALCSIQREGVTLTLGASVMAFERRWWKVVP